MYHAMYEHVDRYGNKSHLNAHIGGFKSENAAFKAVVKRSKVGYVTDDRDVTLFIIRNGHKVNHHG